METASMEDTNIFSSKTIHVSHLGGIEVGFKLSPYDPKKPTCVLVNSMCTTVDLYAEQFASVKLTAVMNLLAIEPLGVRHFLHCFPPLFE